MMSLDSKEVDYRSLVFIILYNDYRYTRVVGIMSKIIDNITFCVEYNDANNFLAGCTAFAIITLVPI